MRITALLGLGLGALLLRVEVASATILLQSPAPARNDRFYTRADKAFVGDPYNWSGVGRNSRWGTLIAPDYVLSAAHYSPAIGSTLTFYYTNDPTGGYETRTIQSAVQIAGTDLWLGKLSAPVSSNVTSYAIYRSAHEDEATADYYNQTIYTFGLSTTGETATSMRLGRNVISPNYYHAITVGSSTGWTYVFQYGPPATSLGGDESYLEVGDSGGPSFIIANGAPALIGIHWAHTRPGGQPGDYSWDTAVGRYVPQLFAAMSGSLELPYVVMPTTATWSGGNSNDWDAPENWTLPVNGAYQDTSTTWASVLFDGASTSRRTITLGANRTLTGITFNAAAGANGFTLSSGTLTLGESGLTNRDADVQTLDCDVTLRSSQRWSIASGGVTINGALVTGSSTPGNLLIIEGAGTTTVSGVVSGTGVLLKSGDGTLVLSHGSSSYSGSLIVQRGTLSTPLANNQGTDGPLGNSSLAVTLGSSGTTGTWQYTGNSASTDKPFSLASGGTGGFEVTNSNTSLTLDGSINGNGALLKTGAGNLVLNAANSYQGGTTVSDGTLTIARADALPAGRTLTVGPNGTVVLSRGLGTAIELGGLNLLASAASTSSVLGSDLLATAGDADISSTLGETISEADGVLESDVLSLDLLAPVGSTSINDGIQKANGSAMDAHVNSVPEPGTLVLLAVGGLMGLAWCARGRRAT